MTPTSTYAREVLAHSAFTGISASILAQIIEDLYEPWKAVVESQRHERRKGPRVREVKSDAFTLEYVDQVLVTLVHLRTDLSQEALAVMYRVSSKTVGRAIYRIRKILANLGIALPHTPARQEQTSSSQEVELHDLKEEVGSTLPKGRENQFANLPKVGWRNAHVRSRPRLKTLHDVFAYAAAEGVILCLDATETTVRRPKAGKKGRKRYVSGKRRANTMKTLVISDRWGRPLFTGAVIPGRRHDAYQVNQAGLHALLDAWPGVTVFVDTGYIGFANRYEQVIGPPPKLTEGASEKDIKLREQWRKWQSSTRMPVEHANSRLKKWRAAQTHHGVREDFPTVMAAVACILSYRY